MSFLRFPLPRRAAAYIVVGLLAATSGVQAESAVANGDSLVVVVSASSPVTEITRHHLADLYMGRTTRFPSGAPAMPIDHRPGSTERSSFSEVYLGRSEAQVKAHWSKLIFTGRGRPPAEAASGEAVRSMVAEDPRAIGYIDRRLVNSSVRIVRVRQ